MSDDLTIAELARLVILARLKAPATAGQQRPWNALAALSGPDGRPYEDQQAVHADKSIDRVFSGTRQLGKSTLAATEHIDVGLKNPGTQSIYVDMDIEHGEEVFWREVMRLQKEFRTNSKIVDGELRFENGSVCRIFSGQPSEIGKLQGHTPILLTVDETQDCHAISALLTMIRPSMMRYGGRILLMGIPGRAKGIGPWWDICEGKSAHLYGQHRGSLWHNPWLSPEARTRLFEAAKAELGADNPEFLRHWMGLWPNLDNSLRVYRYFPDANGYDGAPPRFPCYSLGLDPGGVLDAEAVVVVGFGGNGENGQGGGMIYHVDETVSEKRQGGDWDKTGERVGPLVQKWNPGWRYYDYGSARKGSLSLIYMRDHAIKLDAVPPKDPQAEARRISALFQAGRLWIKKGSTLEADLLYTTWDKNSLTDLATPRYSSSYKQNAADALRAAMWGVYGYQSKTEPEEQAIDLAAQRDDRMRVLDRPDVIPDQISDALAGFMGEARDW